MLASLRIPLQLMGIVPQNAGGFGSIREAAEIYVANGVGIAADAAGRGLSVFLCEKDDLASHTSSASI